MPYRNVGEALAALRDVDPDAYTALAGVFSGEPRTRRQVARLVEGVGTRVVERLDAARAELGASDMPGGTLARILAPGEYARAAQLYTALLARVHAARDAFSGTDAVAGWIPTWRKLAEDAPEETVPVDELDRIGRAVVGEIVAMLQAAQALRELQPMFARVEGLHSLAGGLGALVGNLVRVLAEVAAEAIGAVVRGAAEGLGVTGVVVLLVALYLFFGKSSA